MTNRFTTRTLINGAATAALALGVAACDGSSDSGNGGGEASNGQLTLGVTDAPVDNARAVVVQFSGVELQPQGGERIVRTFDSPRQIDLLALQGAARALLLDDAQVPAGAYSFVRLLVDAQRDTLDSFIELDDGSMVSLFVPSGAQSGLQLNGGLSVAAGGQSDFTIDFDLRKSITNPQGQDDYFLRPSLRLVNNAQIGTIAGSVDPLLVNDADCTNDLDADTGNAVYLFAADQDGPDDVGSAAAPLTSALVALDEGSGQYRYEIGFVLAGDYRAAFTCQARDDDPETDDDLSFSSTTDVTVTAGATTTADFSTAP